MRIVCSVLAVMAQCCVAAQIIIPTPKALAVDGETTLPRNAAIACPRGIDPDTAAVLAEELSRLFAWDSTVDEAGEGGITLTLAETPLPPEGYEIQCEADRVTVVGADASGLFWAVMSLLQVLESDEARLNADGSVSLPRLSVSDYPDNPWRGFMLQLTWGYDADMLRDVIPVMAKWKLNYVVIEWGPSLELDCHRDAVRRPAVTKEHAAEICALARRWHVEPIPALNSLGHLDRAYQLEPYTSHGGLDITRDETYTEFLFPIYEETLSAFGSPPYFHAGMDEAWDLCRHLSDAGEDVASLVAQHITRVHGFLAERGTDVIIWSDMLLAKEQCGPNHSGAINGGPPWNTYRALDMIPKSVLIDYWIYDPLPEFPVTDFLQEQGFCVIVSPWKVPRNFTQYGTRRGAWALGTSWTGFTYAPSRGSFFSRPDTAPVMPLFAEYAWNVDAPDRAELPYAPAAIAANAFGRRPSRVPPGPEARTIPVTGGGPTLNDLGLGVATGDLSLQGVVFHLGDETLGPRPAMSSVGSLAAADQPLTIYAAGMEALRIEGVNRPRAAGDVILYTWAPDHPTTGTNIYGAEAGFVSGLVQTVQRYGSPGMRIPPGGFVLSAHMGAGEEGGRGYRWITRLKPGQSVAIVDVYGEVVASGPLPPLVVRLPDGAELSVDGVDQARGDDDLIVYRPGYGATTGTNQYGVEVAVRDRRVESVRSWQGGSEIPRDGHVLSAHEGRTRAKSTALRALKVGDAVELTVLGSEPFDPLVAQSKATLSMPLSGTARRLAFLHATRAATTRGSDLGRYVIVREDGSETAIPLAYAVNICAAQAPEFLSVKDSTKWLAWCDHRGGALHGACVVEWENDRPDIALRELRLELSAAGVTSEVALLTLTAY